jgi:hypothetical protein
MCLIRSIPVVEKGMGLDRTYYKLPVQHSIQLRDHVLADRSVILIIGPHA